MDEVKEEKKKWQLPTAETIQPKTWIKLTGFFFLALLVLIAFNFAQDNQRALTQGQTDLNIFAKLSADNSFDHNSFNGFGKDALVLWLSTLDQNIYDKLDRDQNLPLCVNHYLVYRQDKVAFNFNTKAFWFEFPNGTQVEFTRGGSVNCYIPTTSKGVQVLTKNCNDVCPAGIESLGNYDFNRVVVQ
jgi:hypothetical protein